LCLSSYDASDACDASDAKDTIEDGHEVRPYDLWAKCMNHFELFGIPVSTDVNVNHIADVHRKLALEFHPDRVDQHDVKARRIAAEKTASLNEALKTLKDPVRRAFYLLKLEGIDLDNESSAARLRMPPDFLEEIMECREALDEARGKKDLPKAQSMATVISRKKDIALIGANLALNERKLDQAGQYLGQLKYYLRFLEEVEAFEESLSS
jgi:molecular chaperone HscB